MPARLYRFLTNNDFGEPKPRIKDAIALAKQMRRDDALYLLIRMNIEQCLAQLSKREEWKLQIQKRLIENVLSEKRIRKLKDRIPRTRYDEVALVHRAQVLTMLKLLIAFGSTTAGNRLVTRDDRDLIGELAITVNSLFQFQQYEHLGADQLEAVLTAEMAPMFELSNPPPDGNGMVRMSEMLGLILDEYRSFNESTHISRQIETIFLFLTGGLNFESLLDLTFIFHSFYAGRREGILFGDETIFFNTENPENIVGRGYLNVLLRQFSAPVETYSKMLLSPDAGPRYFLDMTAFRRRPILRISPFGYSRVQRDVCRARRR
jgi:hypothetical protein